MSLASVILDTNVIVAALRSRRGTSSRVLELVGRGIVGINVSVPLVLEYEAVLKRAGTAPAYTPAAVDALIDGLCSVASLRAVDYRWRPQLTDPADEAVLELAVAAGGAPIITWNVRHFRGAERFGVAVPTPAELLRDIGALP